MIDISQLSSPIAKGDAPLTPAQFAARMRASKERVLPALQQAEIQSTSPELAKKIGDAMAAVQSEAYANNQFNHALAAYRKAQKRLAQYRLADGRPEITEEQETGEVDEDGNPLFETVVLAPAIEPLEPEIEEQIFDEETGEVTGTQRVPNPEIVKDDVERAGAQSVVDGTSDDVKAFE